jgi:hypothetical protein
VAEEAAETIMTTDPVVVQRALDRLMTALEPLCEPKRLSLATSSPPMAVGSPQFLNSICEYMTLSHPSPGRAWRAEWAPNDGHLLLWLEVAR